MQPATFEFRTPCRALQPYVMYYGILRCDRPWQTLTFPLGHTQLLFHLRDPLRIPELGERQHASTLSGQVDFSAHIRSDSATEMLAVAFRPHTLRAFLDRPVSLFRNHELPARDLEDRGLNLLTERILACGDATCGLRLAEEWLLARLAATPLRRATDLRRMAAAVDRLCAAPRTAISELAATACLSRKQFERTFAASVGMNPQEYARIVRFQRMLQLMQSRAEGLNWARIACASGYADQSHMIRECRRIGGHTPVALLKACDPASSLFSDGR